MADVSLQGPSRAAKPPADSAVATAKPVPSVVLAVRLPRLPVQLGDAGKIDVMHGPGRLARGRRAGGQPALLLHPELGVRDARGARALIGPGELAVGGAQAGVGADQ